MTEPSSSASATVPRLGILLNFQSRPDLGEPWDRPYREGLELAAEASRCGIDDIWISEHHGEEDGYCPSPIVAGAAVATAAPNCRVGQGIAVAPLYGHPLRLAEDLAVLDNLSGGRLDVGLGQGYRASEFESIGLPYAKRTRAFEEILDVLRLAWQGRSFDYHGAIYTVKNGLLRPGPVQKRMPLWIGAAAPVSRARAVRYGAGDSHRLELATVGRAGGDKAAQQPLPPQAGDRPRVVSGQGAARSLDQAEPGAGRRLRKGPGQRGELSMQHAGGNRPAVDRRRVLTLDWKDRVLDRGVVQLHHVRPRGSLPAETTSQVGVDDVKPARAKPEPACLDVEDELVPGLGTAIERGVADRLPLAVALHLDNEPLLGSFGTVIGADHRAPPENEPQRSCSPASSVRAMTTSSICSSASALTRSSGI